MVRIFFSNIAHKIEVDLYVETVPYKVDLKLRTTFMCLKQPIASN
jgi:hypothetical protein